LALSINELNEIENAYTASNKTITVGYNRRFSPFVQKAKELLGQKSMPINMIATINAGHIPADVWVHDLKIGGGRIIGEACHFIDLMIFLSGSKVKEVMMNALGNNPVENTDNAIITLVFENGSQGSIHYFANGNKAYSKERIEVYCQGKILVLDNFRKLEGFGFKGFSSMKKRLDKGHKTQFQTLINSVKNGGMALIPFEEIRNGCMTSFAAIESLKQRKWIAVDEL
jgi:predicted dehydrogenase